MTDEVKLAGIAGLTGRLAETGSLPQDWNRECPGAYAARLLLICAFEGTRCPGVEVAIVDPLMLALTPVPLIVAACFTCYLLQRNIHQTRKSGSKGKASHAG